MSRRALVVFGLLAVVVVATYLGGTRRTGGPPLDPRSTAPDGTRGLVEVVTALGGRLAVVDGAPDRSVDVALLLDDRYGREEAIAVERWVSNGGTLIVADPQSALASTPVGSALDTLRGRCEIPALIDVGELAVSVSRSLVVPDGASGCFPADGGAFIVAEARGEGTVISLGGPAVFTNEYLDRVDNAVLAAGLLVHPGSSVAYLRPALPGGGDRSLVDLVDTPVRAVLWQLVVVFGVVVLWRGRRLGHPVPERQPVEVDAAELTDAVGRMLARNGDPARAAADLRDRARRTLSGRLGLALDAPADLVVRTLDERSSLTIDEVRRAVVGPVRTDADLVAVARLLTRLREEITDVRTPTRI